MTNNETIGYAVYPYNGMGKVHFFTTLEEALSYHKKKHPNWQVFKSAYRYENGLEIYRPLEKII